MCMTRHLRAIFEYLYEKHLRFPRSLHSRKLIQAICKVYTHADTCGSWLELLWAVRFLGNQ